MLDLIKLLHYVIDEDASDLHLKAGCRPRVRVDGQLIEAPFDPVTPEDLEVAIGQLLPPARAKEFAANNDADFATTASGLGRFRGNAFRQRGEVGIVLRRVLPNVASIEDLGLPSVVRTLASEPRGMVLVTGPTGSGKTTTLASMIEHINETRACNIVAIEDPIEVVHTDKMAIINQREIGTDTSDYVQAMRRVLRQDPDVILIGEMRDPETVWAALSAAETGHLVLSTLHTTNATETVNRIVDFFPPFQQHQIRLTLASCLKGVICQRLLERADEIGPGAGGRGHGHDRAHRRSHRRADQRQGRDDRGDDRRRRLVRDANLRPEPLQALPGRAGHAAPGHGGGVAAPRLPPGAGTRGPGGRLQLTVLTLRPGGEAAATLVV